MLTRRLWFWVALIAGSGLVTSSLRAQEPAGQKQILAEFNQAVRATEKYLGGQKLSDAAQQASAAAKALKKLSQQEVDPRLQRLLAPLVKDLRNAYAVLELEGFSLPPFPELGDDKPGTPQPDTPGEGVSFTKQIAPILVAKCGRCHIDDAKGRVSMVNYAALMRGSPTDGVIVQPGDGTGSRIVEVIESGDMPRGGKVSGEELQRIVKWIAAGAKFDGETDMPLKQLTGATTGEQPTIEVVEATGKESVRFALEIAPVLIERCAGCHGTNQPRADFTVATFSRMLRGGDSGAVVMPGKPAESLLVKKLKGTAGERMPLRKPPLPADVIAKIETWIAEGAKFDGDSAELPIQRIAALARARFLSPEELSKERAEQAKQIWHLAIPDAQANWDETERFIVGGNVTGSKLAAIGATAEEQADRALRALKVKGETILKGKIVIYVTAQRFDYSEFGTMVEKRPLPRSWRGHWVYDVVNPYILVVNPKPNDDYTAEALLAQSIASMYVAARGEGAVPRWLAEGTGRAIAADAFKDDARIAAWEDDFQQLLERISKPDDFLTGKLSPEDTDTASQSFVEFLMTGGSRFTRLIEALDSGAEIDRAMQASFGGTARQLAPNWARYAVKQR